MKSFLRIFLVLWLSCQPLLALDMVIQSYEIVDDRGEDVSLKELYLDQLPLKLGQKLEATDLSFFLDNLINNHQDFSHASATLLPIDQMGEDDKSTHFVHLLVELQRQRKIKATRLITDADIDAQDEIIEKLQTQRNYAFSPARLEADIETLKKYFWQLGYPHVTVDAQAQELNANQDIMVSFEIGNTKRKTRISDLEIFIEDSKSLNQEILDQIKEASSYKPRSFFLAARPIFDKNLIQEDQDKIKKILMSHGYEDSRVVIKTQEKDELIKVRYLMTLGERYIVKKISYITNNKTVEKLTPKDEPLFAVGTPFTEVNFRKEMERIRQVYGRHGHLFTKVMGNFDRYDGHLQMHISEGPKFLATGITIEGLSKLKLDRALLDLELKASGVITQPSIDEQIKKLMNTGHYSHVESQIVVDENLQESQEFVSGRIIFQVKESLNREIRFSLGASQAGTFGELAYSMNHFGNFGGRLSVFASLSKELQKVGIIFQDPHVGGSDWRGQYITQYEQRENDYEDSSRIRFKALFEKQLTENLSAGIGARLEFVKADLLHQYLDSAPLVLRENQTISGLLGTLTYAQIERDSTQSIASGRIYRAILMPSYSDEGAYSKAIVEAIETIELGRNAWGSSHSIQGRIMIGATTSNTPEIERFKAGGVGTIRGFQSQSLRNEDGSAAMGIISSNVSYSFPLYQNNLKGVLFLEAASLSEDLKSLGSFRVVGGFGVRANLGQALMAPQIEAGIAVSLKDKKGDQLKPFYLMFGEYDPRFDL